jgi:protein TonB
MAFSFVLHGLALLPLAFAGTSASAPGDEPLMVELIRAAPAPSNATEPGIDLPSIDEPPPIDIAEIASTKVDLPAPDEPPPLDTTEVKPPTPPTEQPKPQAQPAVKPQPPMQTKAAPARAAQKSAVTQTVSAPDSGTDQATQTAAAAAAMPAIVFSRTPHFRVPPKPAPYPPRAQELGQQGEVLVRVRLHPDGSIAEIVLQRSSGFELLDRSALAAVPRWQFMPEVRNGHNVAAWVEFPVRFHLR